MTASPPTPYIPTKNNTPLTLHQFYIGDTVRITSTPDLVYKVIAVTATANTVTILIVNPQPDGRVLGFNSQSLRTLDQSEIERVPIDVAPAGTAVAGS